MQSMWQESMSIAKPLQIHSAVYFKYATFHRKLQRNASFYCFPRQRTWLSNEEFLPFTLLYQVLPWAPISGLYFDNCSTEHFLLLLPQTKDLTPKWGGGVALHQWPPHLTAAVISNTDTNTKTHTNTNTHLNTRLDLRRGELNCTSDHPFNCYCWRILLSFQTDE